jgi:hypothetical protein
VAAVECLQVRQALDSKQHCIEAVVWCRQLAQFLHRVEACRGVPSA